MWLIGYWRSGLNTNINVTFIIIIKQITLLCIDLFYFVKMTMKLTTFHSIFANNQSWSVVHMKAVLVCFVYFSSFDCRLCHHMLYIKCVLNSFHIIIFLWLYYCSFIFVLLTGQVIAVYCGLIVAYCMFLKHLFSWL